MSQPQTVVIGSSPKAGSGRRRWVLANVERDLRAKGFHVIASHSLDEIVHSATHAFAKNELRAVIAAGGDGTISLLAQTLPANYPILPLPLGTENLLARYYGCDWRPDQVMAAIELGEIRKIDAGIANGRLFLLMATAGFDAEVARLLHLKRKGHISHLSYCKPILSALRTYPYRKSASA